VDPPSGAKLGEQIHGRIRFASDPTARRFFLVAEQKNGSLRPLREFNERPGAEGVGRLEGVAAALNASWNLRD
jgi:hypothetical protein